MNLIAKGRRSPVLRFRLSLLHFLIAGSIHSEDTTWVYAVQVNATVRASPPQITLSWQPDPYGVNDYTVYRKSKTAMSWGEGTVLSGTTTNFVDADVVTGVGYEYQIVKNAALGYAGFGYIYSGIEVPLNDD